MSLKRVIVTHKGGYIERESSRGSELDKAMSILGVVLDVLKGISGIITGNNGLQFVWRIKIDFTNLNESKEVYPNEEKRQVIIKGLNLNMEFPLTEETLRLEHRFIGQFPAKIGHRAVY